MADVINFLAGQSSLWVQPNGPNTRPEYLGCHGITDITEPMGDETILYCPDPASPGAYIAKNSFTGEPGSITASIVTDLRRTADYLEVLGKCAVPIYIHKTTCGRRDVFSNYDRTFILRGARITQRSLGNVASRTPGDENETTQTFDFSSRELLRIYNLTPTRSTVATVEGINNVSFCAEDRCEGGCGASQSASDLMVAVTDGSPAAGDVLISQNGGAFTASALDPFNATEDVQGVVCFKVGRTTTRILVGLGTTDAAAPLKVSYSDDLGATAWTDVTVGTTNAEFVSNGHALFALDRYHIWVGGNLGNIYFSQDGGVNWENQTPVPPSATAVVAVHFYNPSVGFALYTGGQVAYTADGGSTWALVTASGTTAGKDIHAISPYFVWVVGTDGAWYSHDAGLTWTKRDSIPTASIDFINELYGMRVGSAASGLVYQTINGGFDWGALTLLANAGYNDIKIVNTRLSIAVGEPQGGTGLVAKIIPTV